MFLFKKKRARERENKREVREAFLMQARSFHGQLGSLSSEDKRTMSEAPEVEEKKQHVWDTNILSVAAQV